MSGYKFEGEEENQDSNPDLAQHTPFHFKDKEVEEAVERARLEKLEREQAEASSAHPSSLTSSAPSVPQPPTGSSSFRISDDNTAPSSGAQGGSASSGFKIPSPQAPLPGQRAPATPTPATAQVPESTPTASTPTGGAPAPTIPGPTLKIPTPPPLKLQPVDMESDAAPSASGGTAGKVAKGVTQGGVTVYDAPQAPANAPTVGPKTAATRRKVEIPEIQAEPAYVPQKQETPFYRKALDKLDPLASFLACAAFVVGILAAGYILWGIYGGNIGRTDTPRQAQNAANIGMAAQTLRVCIMVGAISSAVLMLDVAVVGPIMAILGVVMHFFATPLLSSIGPTRAVFNLIAGARAAGYALLVIGLLKCAIDVLIWVIERPARMQAGADIGRGQKAEAKQQNIAATATMFSPCWGLHYCREIIRVKCPAYLARTRCWKFGRGCLCDQEMVTRIMRNDPLEQIKAPTTMSRSKPPCGRCQIFLQHQSLKYTMLSPLAIPATIIIAFWGWPFYLNAWQIGGDRLTSLWKTLSFSVTRTAATKAVPTDMDQYQLSPEQVQQVAQTMFGVILGFFLLIYISKFIEWAIYKMRW